MAKPGSPRPRFSGRAFRRFLLILLADLVKEWPELERAHRRAALLAAYRQHHRWKAADLQPLLRLGVNVAAQRRMARIFRKGGAGVVRPYESLPVLWARIGRLLADIFDPGTRRDARQRLLASTPWWPALIEAAYRGELEAAQRAPRRRGDKEYGHEKPSEIAQDNVAEAAGLSIQQVQRLCRQARASYECGETANRSIRAVVLCKFIASGILREP